MWYLPLAAMAAMTAPMLEPFLIGTYTAPGASEGVYSCTFDATTGSFGETKLVGKASSPSFAIWGKDGKSVYAIEEVQGASVRAFHQTAGGSWADLGSSKWNGNGPCHLALAHQHAFLAAAGYGDGTLGLFGLDAEGKMSSALAEFKNAGSGPFVGRQEGPHVHYTSFSPDDRFVLACDLGTDEILSFPVDLSSGKLAAPIRHKLVPGDGPRHLVLNKTGGHVYVNNELANSVTVLKRNVQSGALESVQTLPTLPAEFKGNNTTAEIVLDPSGRFLYVSNRGHDSVAAYRVEATGLLELQGIYPANVKEPRGMDVDPSGKWLIVAGQNSDDIVSLPIDPTTGRLGDPKTRTKLGKPVSITFQHR